MAGLLNDNNIFTLDKSYRQTHPFIIYYGLLEYSGISDYSVYDSMIIADTTATEIAKVRSYGVKVYQYIPFGSRFKNADFMNDAKSTIRKLKNNLLADGIFFDECEVGYWNMNYYKDPEMAKIFEDGLKYISNYCKSLGLEVIINGVSAYSKIGDYFLWESFSGYWNTNRIIWNGIGAGGRTQNPDGTVDYEYNYNKWTLTGSLRISDNKIINGSKGTMMIDLSIKDIIQEKDKDMFEYVYFEWFGKGANDKTLKIYAYIGNELPYNPDTWEELPKLWKGEPGSWNGINKFSKYIRIELVFDGADSLIMDSCFLAYGYVYPYFDMTKSNPPADKNQLYWNFNLSQYYYLIKNNSNVLCHCYGTPKDRFRMEYTFTVCRTLGFNWWDYTHPLHQTIAYTDILDDPFGGLLQKEDLGNGLFKAKFTGCDTIIDVKNNTYQIIRDEPNYWFNRGIDDFTENELVYENPSKTTKHTFSIYAEMSINEEVPENWYVVDQWTSGATKYVIYYPILNKSLNIRKIYIYDDIFYLYFAFKFEGKIDFYATSPNRYYIYIGSDEFDYGFKGEWFDAPFKSQFMIYNQSLFKWDKSSTDERDYKNFQYIGNTFLEYDLKEDNTFIKYTLKKSVLDEISTKNMKFYYVLEQVGYEPDGSINKNKSYVALIPNQDIDITKDPVYFPNCIKYTQMIHDLYSPHGYYTSEIISCKNNNGLSISYTTITPPSTSVKVYLRFKSRNDQDFTDFTEVANGEIINDINILEFQYSVCLFTTDGTITPQVLNIRMELQTQDITGITYDNLEKFTYDYLQTKTYQQIQK